MPSNSPFDLENDDTYQFWRASKLAQQAMPEAISIASAENLHNNEINAIKQSCQQHNFTHFRYQKAPIDPTPALQHLGQQLGLLSLDENLCAEEDGLTQITVKDTDTEHNYIPYSNKPLGWHTDGYYNSNDQQIYAWLLYCAQPAAEGGENGLLDHDIAYIRLRDENPEWIKALMQADAFTIPPNIEKGITLRPAHSGPVFSISANGQQLHMRYSARQRNIIWKQDTGTQEAAAFLRELFQQDDEYILELRLAQGEGIISNNILHKRNGFTDNLTNKRMMYRARYYERIKTN
jgi:hypothetical protein